MTDPVISDLVAIPCEQPGNKHKPGFSELTLWNQLTPEVQQQVAQHLAELIQRMWANFPEAGRNDREDN